MTVVVAQWIVLALAIFPSCLPSPSPSEGCSYIASFFWNCTTSELDEGETTTSSSPSCSSRGLSSQGPCCDFVMVRNVKGAVEGRGGSEGVVGQYSWKNSSDCQELVKEDSWGLTTISYTAGGSWNVQRKAGRGRRVEESYTSPPTNATCPEDSPGLDGGYISLGIKVEITCTKPHSLTALLGIIVGLFVLLLILLCSWSRQRSLRRRKKLRLISEEAELERSDDSNSESFL